MYSCTLQHNQGIEFDRMVGRDDFSTASFRRPLDANLGINASFSSELSSNDKAPKLTKTQEDVKYKAFVVPGPIFHLQANQFFSYLRDGALPATYLIGRSYSTKVDPWKPVLHSIGPSNVKNDKLNGVAKPNGSMLKTPMFKIPELKNSTDMEVFIKKAGCIPYHDLFNLEDPDHIDQRNYEAVVRFLEKDDEPTMNEKTAIVEHVPQTKTKNNAEQQVSSASQGNAQDRTREYGKLKSNHIAARNEEHTPMKTPDKIEVMAEKTQNSRKSFGPRIRSRIHPTVRDESAAAQQQKTLHTRNTKENVQSSLAVERITKRRTKPQQPRFQLPLSPLRPLLPDYEEIRRNNLRLREILLGPNNFPIIQHVPPFDNIDWEIIHRQVQQNVFSNLHLVRSNVRIPNEMKSNNSCSRSFSTKAPEKEVNPPKKQLSVTAEQNPSSELGTGNQKAKKPQKPRKQRVLRIDFTANIFTNENNRKHSRPASIDTNSQKENSNDMDLVKEFPPLVEQNVGTVTEVSAESHVISWSAIAKKDPTTTSDILPVATQAILQNVSLGSPPTSQTQTMQSGIQSTEEARAGSGSCIESLPIIPEENEDISSLPDEPDQKESILCEVLADPRTIPLFSYELTELLEIFLCEVETQVHPQHVCTPIIIPIKIVPSGDPSLLDETFPLLSAVPPFVGRKGKVWTTKRTEHNEEQNNSVKYDAGKESPPPTPTILEPPIQHATKEIECGLNMNDKEKTTNETVESTLTSEKDNTATTATEMEIPRTISVPLEDQTEFPSLVCNTTTKPTKNPRPIVSKTKKVSTTMRSAVSQRKPIPRLPPDPAVELFVNYLNGLDFPSLIPAKDSSSKYSEGKLPPHCQLPTSRTQKTIKSWSALVRPSYSAMVTK